MLPVQRVRGVLGSVLAAEMCPLDEPASAAFVDLRLKYLFNCLKTSERRAPQTGTASGLFLCPRTMTV